MSPVFLFHSFVLESLNMTAPTTSLINRLDNPTQFLEASSRLLMQSPMLGINTPGDAFVLAWHCLSEGISPLEFSKRYHLIGGKLTMRADYMHAAFRNAGGRIKWVNTGEDGIEAVGEFYADEDAEPVRVSFNIEDARKLLGKNAKHNCDAIDAPGSGWTKDRGAMLRARVISKGIRMVAPEVIAGVYTPDELETIAPATPEPATVVARVLESPKPVESLTYVIAPEAQATTAPAQTAAPEPTPAPTATPASDDNSPVSNTLLQELVALGTKLPNADRTGTLTVKEVGEKLCAAAGVAKPADATTGQVRTLIERIRNALGKT